MCTYSISYIVILEAKVYRQQQKGCMAYIENRREYSIGKYYHDVYTFVLTIFPPLDMVCAEQGRKVGQAKLTIAPFTQ